MGIFLFVCLSGVALIYLFYFHYAGEINVHEYSSKLPIKSELTQVVEALCQLNSFTDIIYNIFIKLLMFQNKKHFKKK